MSGLIVATTKLDPHVVVKELKNVFQQRPWEFRYVLKCTPIDIVVPTDLKAIASNCAVYASRIGLRETFRVTVEKRYSDISSRDIIASVASVIERKVSLDNPSWVVLVQVVGKVTGLTVIKPDEVLSVEREKQHGTRS